MRDWREVAETGPGERPLFVVHGNCQVESLRVLCSAALGDDVESVRIPPVFELEAEDVEPLRALLARTSMLLTQPVVDDYRGLPLGSAQVTACLPPSATVVRVPVLRWAALMPTHAIVRAAGVGDPPEIPYHDLRVLASVARGDAEPDLTTPGAQAVRAVRDISRAQLRVRQEHHGTIDALSILEAAGADAVWTINHPQNGVLRGVAEAVLQAFGTPRQARDPGRVLLSATTAPVRRETLEALGLTGDTREAWVHQGKSWSEEEVARIHHAWYREHPQVVEAGVRRHAETLEALGLKV